MKELQPLKTCLRFVVTGSIFLVILFSYTQFFQTTINDSNGTKDWHEATGQVIESKIVSHEVTGKGNTYTVYEPEFVFEYKFEGKKFSRTGFERDNVWKNSVDQQSPDPSQKVLDQYPVGSEITVYMNPRNWKQAVIFPDEGTTSTAKWAIVSLGRLVLFLIMAGCFAKAFFVHKAIPDLDFIVREGEMTYIKQGDQFEVCQNNFRQKMTEAKPLQYPILLIVPIVGGLFLWKGEELFNSIAIMGWPIPLAGACTFIYGYFYLLKILGIELKTVMKGKLLLSKHPLAPSMESTFKLNLYPDCDSFGDVQSFPQQMTMKLCRRDSRSSVVSDNLEEIDILKTNLSQFKRSDGFSIDGSFTIPEGINLGEDKHYWEFQITFPNSEQFNKKILCFPIAISKDGEPLPEIDTESENDKDETEIVMN